MTKPPPPSAKPPKPYLTKRQYTAFLKAREAGSITIFRCHICARKECGKLIPRPPPHFWCSKDCWERDQEGTNDQ